MKDSEIISEAVVRVSYNPKYKSINGLPVNFAIEVCEQVIEECKDAIRKKIKALPIRIESHGIPIYERALKDVLEVI